MSIISDNSISSEISKGVIYTAYGEVYVDQATKSSQTVKQNCKGIQTALFTDKNLPNKDYSTFDHVIMIELVPTDFNQYMLNRLLSLPNSPFDYTLALDADTLILSDISDVFELLNRFDIGMTHGHNRQKRYLKALQSGKADYTIPYAFGPVQGGFLLYKKNEKTEKYLKELIKLYKQKNYYDDQVSMRELLWKYIDEENLKLYMLPREYNFCNLNYLKAMSGGEGVKFVGEQCIPKILHYSFEKQFGMKQMNEKLKELSLPSF